MANFTLNKSLIKAFIVLGLMASLSACSKEPPPAQTPVVINLTNSSQVPTNNESKGQSVATKQQPTLSSQPQVQPSVPPMSPAQNQAPYSANYQPTANVQQIAAQSPYPPQMPPMGAYNQPRNTTPSFEVEHLDEASFFNTQIHEMAMQLLKNFRGEAGPEGPVVVTTFVDLNNLYRTSPFGRYIAEQLMGELQRAGFNVVEIRKTDSLMIKPKFGEYGLSRDIQEIARQSSARYVLAGTYITRGRFILVNARLISNENNLVASSGLKILRRDPFLEKMLWPTATPESIPAVKVPVKELGSFTEIRIMSGS